MKKRYKIENNLLSWTAEVEIDEDFVIENQPYTTKDIIIDMVEFWSNYEYRLELNDGDYIKTFLQNLAREILYIITEYNYNISGVISEFKNREGWCVMDGSKGIKIISIDDFEFELDNFEVEKI